MGITSENVAHRFGVTREEQDKAAVSLTYLLTHHSIIPRFFGKRLILSLMTLVISQQWYWQVESHRRAAAATASGKFKDEIIPVSTKVYKIEHYKTC